MKTLAFLVMTSALILLTGGCSSVRSALAVDDPDSRPKPIRNPFGDYYANATKDVNQEFVLRTKKGDRSVEVEIPGGQDDMTDLVLPVGQGLTAQVAGGGSDRSPASDGAPQVDDGASGAASIDDRYKDATATVSDREITGSFTHSLPEDDSKRSEIEHGLGLLPSQDASDPGKKSYLASLDHIKQLYRAGRVEAALLEADENLKVYQTDPRLYMMRGTLLDRMGQRDLAIKSWNQALRFDPTNESLRRFIERKQKASVGGL